MTVAKTEEFDMDAGGKVASVLADLRERGVKYCIGAYVDIHGVQKAKVVPIAHLPQMVDGSERYTGYALDGLGQARFVAIVRVAGSDRVTHLHDLPFFVLIEHRALI